jgi:hypothetical protein
MPLEKPEEYCILCKDYVKGDKVAFEVKVKSPVDGGASTWWQLGTICGSNERTFFYETESGRLEPVENCSVAYRLPWADELVRNLLSKIYLKKKYKFKLPKSYAAEYCRLISRNKDKPTYQWR